MNSLMLVTTDTNVVADILSFFGRMFAGIGPLDIVRYPSFGASFVWGHPFFVGSACRQAFDGACYLDGGIAAFACASLLCGRRTS